jgi:TP901 family phage tail tape measure protein
MPGFGGEVKLTGEEAYRKSLTAITDALKKNGEALKAVSTQYEKSDKSITASATAQKSLQDQLQKQKNTLDQARQAYGKYAAELETQKVKHQALTKEYKDAVKELEQIRKTSGEASDAYKLQADKVEKLKEQLAQSNATQAESKATLKEYKAAMNQAEQAVKETEAQLEKLDQGMEETDESTTNASNSARNAANGGFTVLKGVIANLATQVVTKAIEGFKNLAKEVVTTGMEFDSAMSKVAAISGASAEEMAMLTQKAQEMGRTTKFTASESAEAFNYMAMAGWKTNEMLDGLEGILNLAAASGADLAETSDIVTDALTGLGYEAKDAGRLADVMAAAAANANTNVELMGSTFQYVTPVAGALGFSMEDVAVAIGTMANAGIKGERAGTALRSMMTRLASPPKMAADSIEELGITVTDSAGKMLPLIDILKQLRSKFNGLSEAEQAHHAKAIAGQEAMAGLLAIVNSAPDDFEQLIQSVNNSAGAADRMAKTMLNNVGGKFTLLKSQLEGIRLTIWDKLEPTIRKCIDSISRTLSSINWEAAGRKAAAAFEKLVGVFEWFITHWDAVVTGISAIIAAFVAAKIATFTTAIIGAVSAISTAVAGATSLSAAFAALNTVMGMNPIGLVVGALAALAVGIGAVIAKTTEASEETIEFNEKIAAQTDAVNANKESWEQLQATRQENLSKGMSEMSYYEDLVNELDKIVDENGKVKSGYEERASFITSTLANALGLEISMHDGVIEKYGEIRDAIDQTIEKKKAEIILNSQEAAYTQAIQDRSNALELLAESQRQMTQLTDDYAKAQEILNSKSGTYTRDEVQWAKEKNQAYQENYNQLKANIDNQQQTLEGYYAAIGLYEENYAKFHAEKYSEMQEDDWIYVASFAESEEEKKNILQQGIDAEQAGLEVLEGMRTDSNSKMIDQQKEAANQRIGELQKEMLQYNGITTTHLQENSDEWRNNTMKILSMLTGKQMEFKDAGNGQVQLYADGIAQGEPVAKDKANQVARDAVNQLNKQAEAQGMGANVITGFTNGTGDWSLWGKAKAMASSFGNSIMSSLKASLGIHSPSKEAAKVGRFFDQGLMLGIKDEEAAILQEAADFGQSIVGAMSDGLNTGVDTSALAAVRDAIPDGLDANFRVAARNAATEAGVVDTPLVAALKQALSEMKIEMDGDEMGSFVDRTVNKLIYN